MGFEKSAGAVIFWREEKIKYLLLHCPAGPKGDRDFWDFPKGHIEKKEMELDAVKREIIEETGLDDIQFVDGFRKWIKYFFKLKGETVFKIVTFFLAESKTAEVKISSEHIGYEWLSYEEAIERLTFKNAKEILKKAHQNLNSNI